MKKKLVILLLLVCCIEIGVYHYVSMENNKEEIRLIFNDIKEVEYGSLIDISEFVKECNGEIEYPKLDSFSTGKKSLVFKVTLDDQYKEYTYDINVTDSNKPIIELKKDSIEIEEGETLDFSTYINKVYDVVDGDLDYKVEDADYSQPGQYKVKISTADKNNNKSEAIINVKVNKKAVKEPVVEEPAVQENTDKEETNDQQVHNERKVIVINPGHQLKGNSEKEETGPGSGSYKSKVSYGATGVYTDIPERETVLEVGLKLRKELEKRGYIVYMTRTTQDVDISNKQRALYANSKEADLIISLHCDGVDNSSVRGAHTISIADNNPYCSWYKEGKDLATCVINEYCKATGIKNRGVSYRNDLSTLNWSTIPSVMLEMGFISNKEEDLLLNDADFQNKIVRGICNGIEAYLVE